MPVAASASAKAATRGKAMARTIRRIVVALDDSADSRLVLEEAVALAARMKAELSGLFVEDTTLLNAAQLSLTRQVNFSGQTVEALDSQGLERVLRGQAEAIRRALGQAAQRHDLTWSFRVARGKASLHILSAVSEADLVIMGKTTPAVTRRAHIGTTARLVASAPRGSILFSEPRLRQVLGGAGAIVVAYGEGPHADEALDRATHLAQSTDKALVVLLPDGAAGAPVEMQIRERLAHAGVTASFRHCPRRGCDSLIQAMSTHRGALLVLAQDTPLLGEDSVADLIERVDSPVLIVATGGGA